MNLTCNIISLQSPDTYGLKLKCCNLLVVNSVRVLNVTHRVSKEILEEARLMGRRIFGMLSRPICLTSTSPTESFVGVTNSTPAGTRPLSPQARENVQIYFKSDKKDKYKYHLTHSCV